MLRSLLLACALCQGVAFRCPAARRPISLASKRCATRCHVWRHLDDDEAWLDDPPPDADEAAREAALDAVARTWRLPPREDEAADAELPGVLDRSLFDLTNDSWFANLVRDDYYLAETIYAGGFIACMMMVSQALVRWLLLSPPH